LRLAFLARTSRGFSWDSSAIASMVLVAEHGVVVEVELAVERDELAGPW
jgi:hypothetical protein